MPADYYELLGVHRDASQDEIKRAYRQRARELHPDTNPNDPSAEAQFKEITVAYETLSDPERRRRYDMFGPEGAAAGAGGDPFGFGGGVSDIFEAFFGGGGGGFGRGGFSGQAGPPRGSDLEVVADIDFETAVFGGEDDITVRTAVACEDCEATGAKTGVGIGPGGGVKRGDIGLGGEAACCSPVNRGAFAVCNAGSSAVRSRERSSSID